MYRLLGIFLISIITAVTSKAQEDFNIVSGPMYGHFTDSTQHFWMMLQPSAFSDPYQNWTANFNQSIYKYFDYPIGQIRIDLKENNFWVIDYSIEKNFRGFGIGNKMIENLIKNTKFNYEANVKISNAKSIKIFEKNNFVIKKNDESFITYHYVNK